MRSRVKFGTDMNSIDSKPQNGLQSTIKNCPEGKSR